MNRFARTPPVISAAFLAVLMLLAIAVVNGQQIPFVSFIPNGVFFPNPNGASQTYSTINGGIDETGPFSAAKELT